MSHIHVCLVSDQPIPNLTTALQLNPDKVVLLVSKEMKEKAEMLGNVLNNRGFETEAVSIDAYDINDVISVSESLITKCKSCDVTLNITGGTKIQTLGTFQAFYTREKAIYYVDTKNNKVLKLFPENEQAEHPITISIPIKDYLAAYGFSVHAYIQNDTYIYKRKELTNYLAHIASRNDRSIGSINHALHNYDEKSPLPVIAEIPKDDKLQQLLLTLDDVEKDKKSNIRINNHNSLRYLKGLWFEEYVYMTVKALGVAEALLNVEGKWVSKGSKPPKNEFDVLLSKKNRLFYISCKTANPDRIIDDSEESVTREYLYELLALGDRALGLFGEKMLASARPITNDYVRKRAEVMKIRLIDGKNIATIKENLKQWLNK
ncbi:MAG: DUF1887 family protein [Nitrospirae bacterium]|nr:DUF1887 family protein [Nitrospirota bacterium]